MILSISVLVILIFPSASGERCTQNSGESGYCRERDDCLENAQANDCPDGLHCCRSTEQSDKKCHEYGKNIFKETFRAALTARVLEHYESECAIEAVPLIVGGTTAKEKEFPHMAAIGYGTDIKKAFWMCGGSLISEVFVLTAAHCSESEGRGPAAFVRLGATSLKKSDPNAQNFDIVKRISHPKYKPPSRYNDIALFKLSRSVKVNAFVRPACLHSAPDEFEFKKATATGWGKQNYNDNEGSDDLRKVPLTLIDYSKCNSSFSNEVGGKSLRKGILTSQVCAGELSGGKDTCQGDSGGPLQVVRKDPYCMYSVIGVTSFGKFCGFKNAPAVYTRVSYFVPWIESEVWR